MGPADAAVVTTVDGAPGTGHGAPAPAGGPPGGASLGRRAWGEALLAVELGGLAAVAFGRAVLDTFGRSPETFVARGADAATVVAFGLVVALGPYVALGLAGLAARPLGPVPRRRVHLVLVAAVGGAAVWQLGQAVTGDPPGTAWLAVVGAAGGVALALVRATVGWMASFLRFAGCASVVFLVQFLLLSPTSAIVTGDGPALAGDVTRAVAADLGEDPPDVVVLLFDALPTVSLLDGAGHVDAGLFPNFARLAATSTWYRNNTTVAPSTAQAVPALLTGRLRPEGTGDGRPGPHDDENLFTLLGGSYEVHAREAVTRLCPDELCDADVTGGGLGPLLADAGRTWVGAEGGGDGALDLPGALGRHRLADARDWAARQTPVTSRPQLYFHHVVLPHSPWYLTGDGRQYRTVDELPLGSFGMGWLENGAGVGVAVQRHTLQLQAADRLLGDLLDRLEDAERFDDSLVVVTADHGSAFVPGAYERSLTPQNMEHLLWTPLLVKAPGQTVPVVDDANVMSIDVLPTIADVLGVELPWDLDGVPVTRAPSERTDDTKLFQPDELGTVQPPEGESVVEIEGTRSRFRGVLAADLVEGTGPDGAWQRTRYGDLHGRPVEDLRVGAGRPATLVVRRLDDIGRSGTDRPMAEVAGDADLPEGTVVAYALNGTVAAVTPVEPGIEDRRWAHGLLAPDMFVDGGNELTAYVVEGPETGPVLHPVAVTGG